MNIKLPFYLLLINKMTLLQNLIICKKKKQTKQFELLCSLKYNNTVDTVLTYFIKI